MIQRIQTIYFLLSIVSIALCFVFPFFKIQTLDQSSYAFYTFGIYSFSLQDVPNLLKILFYTILALNVIVGILNLATIFLFKNRLLQIRLTYFTLVLIAIWYVLIFLAKINITTFFDELHPDSYIITMHWGLVMPVLAFFFNYLAVRSIRKDEELVQSLNRLR